MVIVKFANAIWNNPKKSIAGAVVLAYAGKWANGRYNTHIFRRVECENAVKYGRQLLHQFENPKKLIVFLNPAANGGDAGNMFDKYASPILHLAGFDVHVVKLRYEGEAKRLMSVLDDADMIVSAGGDGTLSEIVTGLFRRPDELWKTLPIAVLPLGKTNTVCHRLFPDSRLDDQPKLICQAATAIINNETCAVDVMKVQGSSGKTVYALSDIRWGRYCDLQEKAKRYWSFVPFRDYLPFVFAPRKSDWKKPREFSLAYSTPEDLPVAGTEIQGVKTKNIDLLSVIFGSFFRWLWGKNGTNTTLTTEEVETGDILPLEPEWTEINAESIEFVATANSHVANRADRKTASMNVTLESSDVLYGDFVKKGPYTVKKTEYSPVSLTQNVVAGRFKLASVVGDEKQYISIDNDRYDAMDIDVTLLPDCLKLVCSKSTEGE